MHIQESEIFINQSGIEFIVNFTCASVDEEENGVEKKREKQETRQRRHYDS